MVRIIETWRVSNTEITAAGDKVSTVTARYCAKHSGVVNRKAQQTKCSRINGINVHLFLRLIIAFDTELIAENVQIQPLLISSSLPNKFRWKSSHPAMPETQTQTPTADLNWCRGRLRRCRALRRRLRGSRVTRWRTRRRPPLPRPEPGPDETVRRTQSPTAARRRGHGGRRSSRTRDSDSRT